MLVLMAVKIWEAQAIENGKESPGTEVKSHGEHFCNHRDGACNISSFWCKPTI